MQSVIASRGASLLTVVGTLSIAGMSQASFTIDDFTTPQGMYSGFAWDQAVAAPVPGGYRRIFLQNPSGVGNVTAGVADGTLTAGRTAGAYNDTAVYYDGLNRGGLGAFDITQGGTNDRFHFDDVSTNGVAAIYFLIGQNDGGFSRASIGWGSARSGALDVMFSSFVPDNSTPVNFSSVKFISLEIVMMNGDGWSTETTITKFSAIPTPGAAALVGLTGLVGLRRRR